MCKMIKRGLITLDKSKYSLSKYKCERCIYERNKSVINM